MGKISKRRRAPRTTPTHRGIEFHKRHGQHILRNPLLSQSIIDKSGIKPTDTVLEVGPGTGNLTIRILEKAKRVLAYEVDPRMIIEVYKRVQGSVHEKKLQVINGDVLKQQLPYFDVCISNTPYQISSPLTFRLLSHRPMFRSATLMFQREFALRLIAKPGDDLYCRLSVNAQLLARISHVMKVSRNNFRPPPKVESSVVRIEPRNPAPDVSFAEWDGMLRLAFQRKNRMLRAILGQKKVIRMLAAFQGKKGDELDDMADAIADMGLVDESTTAADADNADNADEMEVEKGGAALRSKVLGVLEETDFATMRANKMSIAEFERLLKAFHAADVYFS